MTVPCHTPPITRCTRRIMTVSTQPTPLSRVDIARRCADYPTFWNEFTCVRQAHRTAHAGEGAEAADGSDAPLPHHHIMIIWEQLYSSFEELLLGVHEDARRSGLQLRQSMTRYTDKTAFKRGARSRKRATMGAERSTSNKVHRRSVSPSSSTPPHTLSSLSSPVGQPRVAAPPAVPDHSSSSSSSAPALTSNLCPTAAEHPDVETRSCSLPSAEGKAGPPSPSYLERSA